MEAQTIGYMNLAYAAAGEINATAVAQHYQDQIVASNQTLQLLFDVSNTFLPLFS